MSVPLFLVCPVHNEPALVKACINSARQQTYKNWTMCITVDGCPGSNSTLTAACEAAGNDKRIHIEPITGRRGALWGRLHAIHTFCPHDAVVVMLDGDDSLVGGKALQIIADEFNDESLEFLWTQFKNEDGTKGFCRDMPTGANPFTYPWVTSHMQCFRKRLLWGVPLEMFMGPSGGYYMSGTDQALVLPVLALAKKRKFLPEVLYRYNRTGKANVQQQGVNANQVRSANNARYPVKAKNVLMMVNGPAHQSDMRLSMGEKRAPLGVLSMCHHLRARGHDVRLVDRFLKPHWFPTDPTLLAWADVVGVYTSTPNHADAEWIIREVRRKGFKGMIMAGGPHTVLFPQQVISWGADTTCNAEADYLVSHIVETGCLPAIYKTRIEDLNFIPTPDYELVEKQGIKYETSWPFGNHGKVMTLNTSRSCPQSCAFCETRALWGRKWVGQSPYRVLLDVRHLRDRFGAKAVYFREDNFGANQHRLREICNLLVGEGISWACELRADVGCKKDIIDLMHQAGCKAIYVGAESGSDAMLQRMSKGITSSQIRQMCDHLRKRGMMVALSFVDGFPGETQADRDATNSLIRDCSTGVVWRNPYREPVALKVRGVE